MALTITKTDYKFADLNDDGKEKAIKWFRDAIAHDDWYDSVYEYAATIGEILGIDLKTRPVKLMNGSTRQDPNIFFSGFSSQGDGACFEGSYEYRKNPFTILRPTRQRIRRCTKSPRTFKRFKNVISTDYMRMSSIAGIITIQDAPVSALDAMTQK